MAIERKVCQKCGRNRALRFYRSERGRVCLDCQRRRTRGASRDVRLVETYGITTACYDALLAAQGGGCAICAGKRKGNLDVDHDHALERRLVGEGFDPVTATRRSIRGLLCRRCNRRLLPSAQDSIERLYAAVSYLKYGNFEAQACLGDAADSAPKMGS